MLRLVRMGPARRLSKLQGHVTPGGRGLVVRAASSSPADGASSAAYIDIGGVKMPLAEPKRPELVPKGFAESAAGMSAEMVAHLKWMLQKDLLGQDLFLLGLPGPSRRRLVQAFCELTNREMDQVWKMVDDGTTIEIHP